MWWPGSDWYEGHATLATNTTGTAWAVADGESGIADNARTYLLVASGASPTSDSLRVILVRDAGPPLERVYTDALTPNGRLTIDLGSAFPDVLDERVGVILESMGQTSAGAVTPMPIVVERAMYNDAGGVFWSAGSNLVATRFAERRRVSASARVEGETERDGHHHRHRHAVHQRRLIAPWRTASMAAASSIGTLCETCTSVGTPFASTTTSSTTSP